VTIRTNVRMIIVILSPVHIVLVNILMLYATITMSVQMIAVVINPDVFSLIIHIHALPSINATKPIVISLRVVFRPIFLMNAKIVRISVMNILAIPLPAVDVFPFSVMIRTLVPLMTVFPLWVVLILL